MRAVNLLPSERRDAETRVGAADSGSGAGGLTTTRVAIGGAALAAVVCGSVGFMFVGARGDVAKKQEALDTMQAQVVDAQNRAVRIAQAQQQQVGAAALPADVRAQLDAFNMVSSARVQWDLLLGDVSRVLPQGTWFSSLTFQGAPAPTAAPAGTTPVVEATPTGFTATGFAVTQPVVARLMQRLALVPMLSDITLQRSERANVGTDQAFQFTLSANVRLDGAS